MGYWELNLVGCEPSKHYCFSSVTVHLLFLQWEIGAVPSFDQGLFLP